MCDFTGWRNMWMRWCLNKMCQIKAFQCRCESGILSNWMISCFHGEEEDQNVGFYRVEEHIEYVGFE